MMVIRSVCLVLMIAGMVLGNTYYIDYSGGSDANTGTSKSSSWKRCPGMSGFSGAYTHSAGDVFIFKGGVVWPSAAMPFAIANSGAAGKIDAYTTDQSWYSGSSWAQPTFDGQLFGQTLFSASGVNYIRINDLRFINAGSLAANGVIAIRFISCSDAEVSNNTFATESWGSLYITAEKSGDFYDILVHHNDISRCAFAMRIVPAAASAIMHNVQLYNNAIHDFHSQLSGQVHGDGIQHYCSPDNASTYDRYIDGFKIYNNRFYGDFTQVSGTRGAMTSLIYITSPSAGIQIYNNVFAPQVSGSQSPNFFESFIGFRDNPNRGGRHKIYNNTFYTPAPEGQVTAILENEANFPSPGLDIKNNIISNFTMPFDLRSANHTIDCNDYTYVRNMGRWAGSTVNSFAAWQALGLDQHGMNVGPGFVSTADLHLNSNSPCVGKGADLSSFFTTDCEGNARPGDGAFTLGAYETGATPPPPPQTDGPALWWPADGATDVPLEPSLTWSTVSGALSYTLQVATDTAFGTIKVNKTGITANSFDAPGLANGVKYYWRVRVIKESGAGGWTPAWEFTASRNGTVGNATPIFGKPAAAIPSALGLSLCQSGAVQIALPQSGAFELSVYSLNGQKACVPLAGIGAAGYCMVSLSQLGISKGFYLLRLSMGGKSVSGKVFMVN
jgi:hypothetical protein